LVGSAIVRWPAEAKILAHLDGSSFVDLDGNRQQDPNEPSAPPVMGVLRYGSGLLVFLGDQDLLHALPQPLMDNMMQAFFPRLRLPPR
jgi:hypothetical protein